VKEYNEIKMYPVPEFKEEDSDEIPYFKVKMASLDDQIQAMHLSENPSRLLLRFLEMFRDGKEINYEDFRKQLYYDDLHPKTVQACNIFQRCVLQPKFKIGEVMKLSETHPDLVNNIAAFALGVEEEKK
jgi:hypothetical protein